MWCDLASHTRCPVCDLIPAPPCLPLRAVRNRFVVFAGAKDWRTQDPTTVPPEWHGWLHYISDENPANVSS